MIMIWWAITIPKDYGAKLNSERQQPHPLKTVKLMIIRGKLQSIELSKLFFYCVFQLTMWHSNILCLCYLRSKKERKILLTLLRVEREVKSSDRRVRSENEFMFMSGRLNFYFPEKPMTFFFYLTVKYLKAKYIFMVFVWQTASFISWCCLFSIFIYRIVWNCCNEFRNPTHIQRPRLL